MNAFEFLGLQHDADEPSIKRAYAQRLRRVRPDEDPGAFQQLHEVYQQALKVCRMRLDGAPAEIPREISNPSARSAAPDAEDEKESPPRADPSAAELRTAPRLHRPGNEVVRTVHTTQAPAHPTDVRELVGELVRIADTQSPDCLESRLQQDPALWSLHAKATVGNAVIEILDRLSPPFPADAFERLLEFFNLAQVGSKHDALMLLSLRKRLHLRWQLCATDPLDHACRHRRLTPAKEPPPPFARGTLRLLSAPFHPLRALAWSMLPGWPSRVTQFINALDHGRIDRLPPELDRHALRFWMQVANGKTVSWPAFCMRALRATLLGSVFYTALRMQSNAQADEAGPLALLLIVCGLYGLTLVWRVLRYWLIQPERPDERARLLRLGVLPVAAMGVLALGHLDQTTSALTLFWFCVTLAIARVRMRAGFGPWNIPGWSLGTLLACSLGATALTIAVVLIHAAVGAAAILIVCSADVWLQRKAIAMTWFRRPNQVALKPPLSS